MLFVDNAFVVIADFQKLVAGDSSQLFRREQKFVGTAKQFVVFVVFPYIIEERIDKTIGVLQTYKPGIVEKFIYKFVFVIFRNAIYIVVMRIESAAVYVGAFNQFGYGNFVYYKTEYN